MSVRSIYSIILLLAATLTFIACDKLIYDQPGDEPANGGAKVFLSVNIQAARESGLRAINEDVEFDDRVHHLALLVFDSNTGERLADFFGNIGKERTNYSFTLELTPGQRDFYFVANMPEADFTELLIPDKTAMDNYMKVFTGRDLDPDLYLGASETVGFPMARVYLNQEVTEGGTVYQPKPFKPRQYDAEERQVVVNASGNGAVGREYVELIRVVAKLEVRLDGGSNLGVDKVYFRNANGHFRLIEFETAPTTYFNDNTSNTELRQLTGTGTYMYYMPEALITSATWSDAGNNQPINYFTIVTVDGTEYDVPIISNEASITSDYLAKAKGTFSGFTPDYNIHRNRHYLFTVKNLEQIEIIYEIDPWNVVNKSTYMGYGYNVEVDDNGNIKITNTIDDCMPHKVRLVAVNGAYFGTPGNTTVEYGYESESETGYDEQKSKAGYSEGFAINKEGVTGGLPYLEVYYNKVPGAGVTPDKVFTK